MVCACAAGSYLRVVVAVIGSLEGLNYGLGFVQPTLAKMVFRSVDGNYQ